MGTECILKSCMGKGWADWRLQLTGRPNLATILQEKAQCDTGRCRVDG